MSYLKSQRYFSKIKVAVRNTRMWACIRCSLVQYFSETDAKLQSKTSHNHFGGARNKAFPLDAASKAFRTITSSIE